MRRTVPIMLALSLTPACPAQPLNVGAAKVDMAFSVLLIDADGPYPEKEISRNGH